MTTSLAMLSVTATIVVVIILLVWGIGDAFIVRQSLRNFQRRPLRTMVIIVGLMLTTVLIAAASTVNATLVLAVKTVAIANVGRVDESVLQNGEGLGLFPVQIGTTVMARLAQDPLVAGVAPSLRIDGALVIDTTQRQVRGSVNILGMDPRQAGPLRDFSAQTSAPSTLEQLGAGDAILNASVATALHASVGDHIAIYSSSWAGQALQLRVVAIGGAGPLGQQQTVLTPLSTLQHIAAAPGMINRVYIANVGNPLTGSGESTVIARTIQSVLPPGFQVQLVKADAVNYALSAETLFGRILNLYTLFALAIDVLLIVLIFALLAAERRMDLGTLRAFGFQRGQLVEVMLFEAALYNATAALPGALAGLGLGYLVVTLINPTVAHLGFPLLVRVRPVDFVVTLCLGFLFSLLITALTISATSKLNIAAALHNAPDPPSTAPHFHELWQTAVGRQHEQWQRRLASFVGVLWGGCWRGFIPLAFGLSTMALAARHDQPLASAIGAVVEIGGIVLLLRWLVLWRAARDIQRLREDERLTAIERKRRQIDRVSTMFFGAYLVVYWGMPPMIAHYLAPSRFNGGIEEFFLAGILMVLGIVLAGAMNLSWLLTPLRALGARSGRLRHIMFIGLIYPAYQRLRTGIGLALFALVTFVMVVMASLTNSTSQRYNDISQLTGGYDIIGQSLSQPIGGIDAIQRKLAESDTHTAAAIQNISAAVELPLAIIEPGGNDAGWRLYPVAEVSGDFLKGAGLPLVARAQGYATDAAVWAAVRDHPGDVVIDAGALATDEAATLGIQAPGPPQLEHFAAPPIAATLLGPSSLESAISAPQTQALLRQTSPEVRALLSQPAQLLAYTLRLSNLTDADGKLQPTTVWAEDFRGNAQAARMTIIGIVNNTQGQRYGMLGTVATFAPLERGLTGISNSYYYFQLRPSADVSAIARTLSSDLLEYGFETTVISQALRDLNAPELFATQVLLRLVGLMLFVGTAALMISGLRSVVERRQQIGMLRALGFQRWEIQLVFFVETVLVAFGGTLAGLGMGLLLCHNGFALTFTDATQLGIALIIPWGTIAAILLIAIAAAAVAVAIPAYQASRVPPAAAMRYE